MSSNELISFDYAIKYLLKDKGDYEIVEGFISVLLASAGYGPVKIKALLESESNKEEKELKRSIADVIVEDEKGIKYIVEIDRSYTTLFIHKACFNTSRLIVDSVDSNSEWGTIKKIFHINLIYFPTSGITQPLYHGKTIFHEIDEQPHNIHLEDKAHREFELTNILPEYFIISVPQFDDVIKKELHEWLYMLKHSEVKESFKSPYMKKVADRLSILKMSPQKQREYYEYRNKTLKDRDYLVSAEEKGREEGREERNIEIARSMLSKNIDINTICEITSLSIEEIKKLKQ